MIEHVKQQLAEKYTNYELVITEVHDYCCILIQESKTWHKVLRTLY